MGTQNTLTLKQLYLSYICPSTPWVSCSSLGPHQQGLIESLEKMQNLPWNCLKKWNLDYVDLLRTCDLSTQAHCRRISTLMLLYEILHGRVTLPNVTFKNRPKIYNLRKFGSLSKPLTQSNVFHFSFSHTLSHLGTSCHHPLRLVIPLHLSKHVF